MDRRSRSVLGVLVLVVLGGCSGSNEPGTTASASRASAERPAAAGPADPMKRAAYQFLDAVMNGDTQRAMEQLTPLAIQRIHGGDKVFVPPGQESLTFRIGEARQSGETQALVQCLFRDSNSGAQAPEEEMCCLMRLIDGQWRVSGVAFQTGPNQPLQVNDFEQAGDATPQPRPQLARGAPPVTAPATPVGGVGDRYAPVAAPARSPAAGGEIPRTAQDPFAGPPR